MLSLLGLAFAGADFVFEVDDLGEIAFALGAAERLTGQADTGLIGQPWARIFSPDESELLDALLRSVGPGERQGPLRLALRDRPSAPKRHAMLSVFRLPQNARRLSCALSLGPAAVGDQSVDRFGLIDPLSFPSAAEALINEAQSAGLPVRMHLVELSGFHAETEAMKPDAAQATKRRLAAALRAEAYQGVGAAEVAIDRYAVLRGAGGSAERFSERIKAATGQNVSPVISELALAADGGTLHHRAMRYALDRFIEDGPAAAAQGFSAAVQRTVRETAEFKNRLAEGAFQLAYQPVVRLSDGGLHHFEALTRFEADASPAQAIRLAEELDLIFELDIAVAKSVARVLAKRPSARIAVNVSALSLMQPRLLAAFTTDLVPDPAIRRRMFIEVTETKKLHDLTAAQAVIEQLCRAGYVVCLDDFGAGAASLDYLRRLHVAYVKIDGRFIQQLHAEPRDAIILKHIVALCGELGISTIAEMIETPETADIARNLGVELGQGWAFAKPLPEPVWEGAQRAHRRGEVVQWS